MVWFKQRKQLEEAYNKWLKEYEADNSPFNVITFLAFKELLNAEEVSKFLKKGDK